MLSFPLSQYREFRGAKYDASLSTVEIAKRVREDINTALIEKRLPKGIKLSVKSSSFAGGSSITITIKAFPEKVLNPAYVYADKLNVNLGIHHQTYAARSACAELDGLLKAYLRDGSNPQTDFFNCNFYSHVEMCTDTSVEREALLADTEAIDDLRVAMQGDAERLPVHFGRYDRSKGERPIPWGW